MGAVSVLVGAVAATGNDLTFAEAVGLADGVAPVFLANLKEVGRLKAPELISGADLCCRLAIGKVGHRHPCGLLGYCAGRDADHGAEGVKVTAKDIVPFKLFLLMFPGLRN